MAGHETDPAGTLSWSLGGMDCAACAAKIKGAVERLPGVSSINVSVMSERLTLRLDGTDTAPETIERTVKGLGYTIARHGPAPGKKAFVLPGDATSGPATAEPSPAGTHHHGMETPAATPWHGTSKGRLVLVTGALLALAWLLHFVVPGEIAPWLFAAACLVGLVPIARRAFAALRSGQPFTIEGLMTIAGVGALLIGAAEEAALVIFLFAVGEVLEGVAANQARASIRALGALVPRTALIVLATGETRTVDAAGLSIGDRVLIRPGDRIPADGVIAEGVSGIDESPVTGESVPKTRGVGDEVFAGSINTEAALTVRVTKAAEDNTIARIIRLVEEAQEARAPTERFIDRFSRWYMPAIVGLAIFVAVLPPLVAAEPWGVWIYRALALLLIGCPCALVISVPASIASALSSGARRGLLMKGGAVIEATATTTTVAFDKTGTLTVGRPQVTDVEGLAGGADAVLALAAGVEAGSSHPLATAILAEAARRGVAAVPATGARVLPGRGVEARTALGLAYVTSPRHAGELGLLDAAAEARIGTLEAEGKTIAVVMDGETLHGVIALRDEPREDAAAAVIELRGLGVRAVMLTGDNRRTAEAIAGTLGMESEAELLPDDKVAAIRRLSGAGGLMMIGDGINDAPALAAATVGIAMGSGTDVALETADGALLRNRVTDAAALIRLARATMGNIRQNIAVALGLKAVFLVTTVAGFTGLWIAILADTGATVLVTLNALRLLRFDPERGRRAASGHAASMDR
ncbi:Cd2+/Zn2+-exporting ATPase [Amaricoccus macauensis]|uniref:P-type Zn(2+) transporter n=1 Tax=Amaricoccus macauensis TaxID=57001 RepID=A0A840SLY8_9RHOB|nr:heavy metal translocating P-type ATPase [Amaricoccus macauensis]MBB5224109.1 Cd2+/Zn2+-exporting ATPase [Amaricoccus macauensis]